MPAGEFPAGYNQFASIFVSVARRCFKNEPVIVGVFQFISAKPEKVLCLADVDLCSPLSWLIDRFWKLLGRIDWTSIEIESYRTFAFSSWQEMEQNVCFLVSHSIEVTAKKENWEEKISPSAVRCSIMQSNDLWSSIALSTTSQVNCRRLNDAVGVTSKRFERKKKTKSECRTQYKVTTDAARGHWPECRKEKLRKRREVRRKVKDRHVVKCFSSAFIDAFVRFCAFSEFLIKFAVYASSKFLIARESVISLPDASDARSPRCGSSTAPRGDEIHEIHDQFNFQMTRPLNLPRRVHYLSIFTWRAEFLDSRGRMIKPRTSHIWKCESYPKNRFARCLATFTIINVNWWTVEWTEKKLPWNINIGNQTTRVSPPTC